MNCVVCGKEIPSIRLEALPNTQWCVSCSPVEKYKGYMVYPHKTGGECVMVNPQDKESVRIMDRLNKRSR